MFTPSPPKVVPATPVASPVISNPVSVLPQEAVDTVATAKQEAAALLMDAKKQALVAIEEEAAKQAEDLKMADAAAVDIAAEAAKISRGCTR